jgi:putative transposase
VIVQFIYLKSEIINVYNNFQHKLSGTLVDENQAIEVETFMIKNLIKNSKLAKVITDISIRSLYIKIDKCYPSTKACFNCDNVNDLMKLKEQIYNCENYGSSISRNYNSVFNIKR